MTMIREMSIKGRDLKQRIEKFGAPLGNKNAVGPHNMSGLVSVAPSGSGHHSVERLSRLVSQHGGNIGAAFRALGGHAAEGKISPAGMSSLKSSLKAAGWSQEPIREFPNNTSKVVGWRFKNKGDTVGVSTYHGYFGPGKTTGTVLVHSQTQSR